MRRRDPLPTWDELVALAAEHDIQHVGVAPADVLDRARTALLERKAAGLDAGMAFTYRNPDRSTDPGRAVEGARSILVFAKPYLADHEPDRPPGAQARVARYAWVDHYGPLRTSLREIARRLRRAGHRATAFTDDNAIVDREVAYLGGLGWFGKNANLLLPGAGSFFVLGSIITTAEYEPSTVKPDGCGTCTRCIDGCPTGAIVAPGVIDANRCLAWLVQRPGTFPVEYREALGDRLYGCDDCQEVCPPSVRLGSRHRVDVERLAVHPGGRNAPDGEVQAWVDVLDVLESSDDELLARFGRWYIPDRDPLWLRRNALVVLGNVGEGDDGRTQRVLRHYGSHPSEPLREHARWAAERLGLQLLDHS
jgi:epoxyqueuosine reductase